MFQINGEMPETILMDLYEEKTPHTTDNSANDATNGEEESEAEAYLLPSVAATKSFIIKNYPNDNYYCSICHRSFTDEKHAKLHSQIHGDTLNHHNMIHKHSNEKPFSCSTCGQSFRRKADMKRHIMAHTNEKLFSCLTCTRSFARKSTLNRHLVQHMTDKPFSCSICKKPFSRRYILNTHVKTFHEHYIYFFEKE